MNGAPAVTPRAESRPRLLSIVCPAYNEDANLGHFATAIDAAMRVLGQPYEIVFVNDGSTDASLAVMSRLRDTHGRVAIVDLSRNFGKEIATTAGLDQAQGDAIVVMDADLQDPPEVIGLMIDGWREGYDVVYARRRERRGDGPVKRMTAALFYKIIHRIGDVEIPENVGDFRLMSRKAVDAVCSLREHHRFMKGIFAWVGFPSKAVLYDRAPRVAGSTKWNYWRLWNLSIEGITSSTLAPLKISTYFGFATALVAFLAGAFFIFKTLFFGDAVPGFPTLVVVVLFLGGIQLMVLGVIGEYLGRVFNETKARPLYFATEIFPSNAESVRPPVRKAV
ncbi:MAG: glycosyl transferase family 2 [Alphaproteobacteria bacterium RIFCSPHIGHO2_12_FULL_63_12]|nr:MAG: glycosyl transferase family 2 [Alphaproteobacteria bacterium RIFCSPHIGHO2_12_FULL_63_12]